MSDVYFIQAGDDRGDLKIGYAKDPKSRLRDHQVSCPLELRLLYAFPAGDLHAALEKALHYLFDDHCVRGEWFRWSPELQAAIDALRSFESKTTTFELRTEVGAICLVDKGTDVSCTIRRFVDKDSGLSLFCSECGCMYAAPGKRSHEILRKYGIDRRPGQICGDTSGGANTDIHPCNGTLQFESYTNEVLQRQRRSMLLDPLVGCWFHTFNPDNLEQIQWQGQIVRRVDSDRVIVQLYDWIIGAPSNEHLVHVNELRGCALYNTNAEMRDAYERRAGSVH